MPHIYHSQSITHVKLLDEYDWVGVILKETERRDILGQIEPKGTAGMLSLIDDSGPYPNRNSLPCHRLILAVLLGFWGLLARGDEPTTDSRKRIQFISTADGTTQEAFLILPQVRSRFPTPMVVNLHSWSADLAQRSELEGHVRDRGWVYLAPNFRGPNNRPEACGSPLAQQDVLDAVEWAIEHHRVDRDSVFLTGASGGGHMTMLMVGRYPSRWKAASAWVGISDLASWHRKHQGSRYGEMLEKCCGGAPGDSVDVDRQYAARSPLNFIAAAHRLPLDLLAGADDGHTGSVPIRHSIDAFNRIAAANQSPQVTEQEIAQLSKQGGRLAQPRPGDQGRDPDLRREFFLRRHSHKTRLTIFDGGHESIGRATMAWFESHR